MRLRLARSLTALTLGAATLLPVVGTLPAEAAACRQSTYIPGLSPITLVSRDGRHTLQVKKRTQNRQPVADIWYDGAYRGRHVIPVRIWNGKGTTVTAVIHQYWGTEISFGQVRQVLKRTAKLRVCGTYWRGNLP
ncbi:hypothetical protein [Sphaerisporangium corydalis]|uniref:Uncharacterized protein n=1 Tax=Sphaerisporangium corydalis TaxID=1441875 RepID=A0ABV9EGV7_9ACTN|nr:hypothetical protein [Sphaerisporangium corydalis]